VSVQERLDILRDAKPNTWLVFSADEERVLGMGDTFGDAAKLAEESGDPDAVLTFVPETWAPTLL
jgi:hypothetical protein